jgi:hypothetical protein
MMNLLKWAYSRFAPAKQAVQTTPPIKAVRAPPFSMTLSAVSAVRRAEIQMNGETDAELVAQWMAATLERDGYLYQEVAVNEIAKLFGTRFTYVNASGNAAIRREVLQAFGRLTGKSGVWEVGARVWRKRVDDDVLVRQQECPDDRPPP